MSGQLLRAPHVDLSGDPSDPQSVFRVFVNTRSRDVLSCLNTRSLTADELTARTDLPRSTLYRYHHRLVDGGLVDESVRLDRNGR